MKTTQRLACIALTCALFLVSSRAFAQRDPGVRGGLQNTGGGLQQQGIPIPHPPLIGRNPTNGATVNENELASFEEGIIRAGHGVHLRSVRRCDGWISGYGNGRT